ncbi:hypothetical protein ACIBI9_59850 [Nonomuraea sp. NPDC050451]
MRSILVPDLSGILNAPSGPFDAVASRRLRAVVEAVSGVPCSP